MRQNVLGQRVLYRSFWNRLKHPLAGLILVFGMLLTSMPSVEAQNTGAEAASETSVATSSTTPSIELPVEAVNEESVDTSNDFPADGIYVYGRSSQPGQLGVDYAVMEVRNRQAVGAFYQVSSSFDCFHGEVGSEQVNLTVINSYEQSSYSYSLPLDQTEMVASGNGAGSGAVKLVGLHSIDTVSDMDMSILSTCRTLPAQDI